MKLEQLCLNITEISIEINLVTVEGMDGIFPVSQK